MKQTIKIEFLYVRIVTKKIMQPTRIMDGPLIRVGSRSNSTGSDKHIPK